MHKIYLKTLLAKMIEYKFASSNQCEKETSGCLQCLHNIVDMVHYGDNFTKVWTGQ